MKKRGFTLIELVAVLGIISLVSAVAILRFNIIENFKVNTELQTLINDCDYAKMKAMSRGEKYTLIFDKYNYQIIGTSIASSEKPINRELSSIYFRNYTDNNEISFTKNGTVILPKSVAICVSDGADDNKLAELRVRVGLGYVRIKK